MRKVAFQLAIVSAAMVGFVRAESTLHIGFGAGTPCAQGCGQDPNHAEGMSDTVDIYFNNQGSKHLAGSVLLILGVPNETNPNLFDDGSIASVTTYNSYAGSVSGGDPLSWAYDGYKGAFTADYEDSVYSFLGLERVNHSESFKNWGNTYAEWNTQLGVDPVVPASSFGIYVFSLFAPDARSSPLQSGGLINVIFSNPRTLPIGTYIVAYGEDAAKKPFGTPFTEAGLQGATPEPTTLLLCGTFLVALGLAGRVRLRAREKRSVRAEAAPVNPVNCSAKT